MLHIDPELIKQAREGDESAARVIIERLHRPVLAVIYRFFGSRFKDQVEEAGQEVFLRVFRSLGTFDLERGVAFSTWVYSIARNYCRDVMTKQRLRTVSLTSNVDEGQRDVPHPASVSNKNAADWSDLGEEVERAMSVLSEEHRMAFILRQYEGLRYVEIAQVVGAPESTVKTRIQRARKALRGILSRHLAASA